METDAFRMRMHNRGARGDLSDNAPSNWANMQTKDVKVEVTRRYTAMCVIYQNEQQWWNMITNLACVTCGSVGEQWKPKGGVTSACMPVRPLKKTWRCLSYYLFKVRYTGKILATVLIQQFGEWLMKSPKLEPVNILLSLSSYAHTDLRLQITHWIVEKIIVGLVKIRMSMFFLTVNHMISDAFEAFFRSSIFDKVVFCLGEKR